MNNSEKKPDLKESFRSRRFKVGAYSIVISLVVIAIAVVVNFFVSKVPVTYTELDFTGKGLYKLSEQTKEIVAGLDGQVDVYWIVQTGTESEAGELKNILEQYGALSSKLKITKIDPIVNPTFAEQYTSDTIQNNSLIVVYGDRSKFVAYTDIYLYDLSTYYYDGNYTVDFDGENAITNAIDFVTSENLPKLYVLEGHGETEVSTTVTDAVTKENILVEQLNLISTGAVPADANCILIYGPASDISTAERDLLLDYLSSGGNVMLLSDFVVADFPNLMEVMAYYGVSAVPGVIMEGDSDHCAWGYLYYLLPDMESHAITDPLINNKYLTMLPMAHGIAIADDARDTLTIEPLFTTTDAAYAKANLTSSTSLDREEGDIAGPFKLGVAVTDTAGDQESHVVWISCTSMLSDTANEMVSGGNLDLFINAVGWMCDKENAISIHAKSLSTDYLTVPSSSVTQLGILLIGAVPLVFIVMGVIVLVRRRRK